MEKREVCNDPAMGFPENKIVLLNGNVLDCIPKSYPPKKIESNDVKLDTTGRYFSVGKRKRIEYLADEMAKRAASNKDFFLQHVFFFLHHASIIMSDSRMFLAPVDIESGLAYIGNNGFKSPTLGVYLEWWLSSRCDVMHDEEGEEALTYHIMGSPLSGCNHCSCIYADGKTKRITHSPFSPIWHGFVEVNRRYNEAKQIYESYTLQEVFEKLQNHSESELSTLKTTLVMRNYRIDTLEKEVKKLQSKLEEREERIHELYLRYNQSKIELLRSEFLCRKTRHDQEMNALIQEKSLNKKKLHQGVLSMQEYQKRLRPIEEKKRAFNEFKHTMVEEITKDGAVGEAVAREMLGIKN